MYKFKNVTDKEATLHIEGEIVYESFWESFGADVIETAATIFVAELKKHDGKKLTIYIDSPGGDILAASKIYTALIERKGQTVVKIDGLCASAASTIAMAGSTLLMSPTALMMIHNPSTVAWGEAKDMRHTADVLDEAKQTAINAYEQKTKLPRDKIARLMDKETWMSSKTAIDYGFADGEIVVEQDKHQALVAKSKRLVAVYNSWQSHREMEYPAPEPPPGVAEADYPSLEPAQQLINQQKINQTKIYLRGIL
jgi:ATP-dependent Clp protease protease subunit